MVDPGQLRRLLSRMFDEAEFFSPHGVRWISAYHRDHPFMFTVDGQDFRVDYEPGESSTGLFGGNSNWRGPVWLPLNALLVESLERFDKHLGADFLIEVPTGSATRSRSARPPMSSLAGWSDCSCRRTTAGCRRPAAARGLMGCCGSTSTSTATPAKVSVHRTRPGGPRCSRTWC